MSIMALGYVGRADAYTLGMLGALDGPVTTPRGRLVVSPFPFSLAPSGWTLKRGNLLRTGVRELQEQLARKGFQPGVADGVFGEKSWMAMVDAQFNLETSSARARLSALFPLQDISKADPLAAAIFLANEVQDGTTPTTPVSFQPPVAPIEPIILPSNGGGTVAPDEPIYAPPVTASTGLPMPLLLLGAAAAAWLWSRRGR
mgnify:CR=1 FL=1